MEESGNKRQEVTESIFSAALLPLRFYCDLIKGHSCRALILAAELFYDAFSVLIPSINFSLTYYCVAIFLNQFPIPAQ